MPYLSNLRFRRNRGPVIPEGTTHVLGHLPAFLLEPDPTGGTGSWDIQTLANYLAGTPDGEFDVLDGPDHVSERRLAEFASQVLGVTVALTRFEVEIDEGGRKGRRSVEPAFYVTPVSAG